jgi:hypothetical protein
MDNLNYAQAYKQALANAFPFVLHFGDLYNTPNNSIYKTVDAKTIQIPKLTTSGRVDGDRDAVSAYARHYDNSWEPKVLNNHRMWDTLVHPMDINQTNLVTSITNITKTFNETQKFPEMDRYCVSKIYADWATQGGIADETVLTATNILGVFDTMMTDMDEANVPVDGRILYTTPAVGALLKQADKISRSIDVSGNGDKTINRIISRLDEVKIVKVPSINMKTVYDFTNGATVGTSAEQINMFLVHPLAVLTPVNYSFVGLDEPDAKSQGKWYYYEEGFEDVFILNERKSAIAFNITPTPEPPAQGGGGSGSGSGNG